MADKIAQILTALAVMMLAAVVFVAGLGFLAAAAYSWLATTLPAAAAAAIVGVGSLVLALLLLMLARAMSRPRTAASRPASGESEPSGPDTAMRLGEQLGPLVRRNWKAATAGAFAIGLVLGVSPRARRALSEAVRKQL